MSKIINNTHKSGNDVCTAETLIMLYETFARIFRTIKHISVNNIDSSVNTKHSSVNVKHFSAHTQITEAESSATLTIKKDYFTGQEEQKCTSKENTAQDRRNTKH